MSLFRKKRAADPKLYEGGKPMKVRGEQSYQDALNQITRGASCGTTDPSFPIVAVLAPEPDNPYDANAVAVL